MKKCLLVKIKDNRKYLVPESNLPSLLDFLATFHAEVYRVTLVEGKVLKDLKDLANAICDQDYNPEIKVKKLKKIFPQKRKSSQRLRSFIENKLLKGKPLALKQLEKQYPDYSYVSLCNHFSSVRKVLTEKGYKIAKVGQGAYCLAGCSN